MGYTKPSYIGVNGGFTGTNPVDSTTYYCGCYPSAGLQTTGGLSCIVSPCKGVVRAVILQTISATATGTSEDWTWVIRLNNTTDYTFDVLGAATAVRRWDNYALNIPIGEGEYIELKTTTPAWATNPEGTRGYITVLIEVA